MGGERGGEGAGGIPAHGSIAGAPKGVSGGGGPALK